MAKQEKKIADNEIFVGSKPFMNYVNAVTMLFASNNELKVVARGKYTSRAIDIVEMIKRKMSDKLEKEVIKIGSESFPNKDNKKVNVSTIEIFLKKK